MFEFLTRTKVYETVDLDKKNQVIQSLNEVDIDYIVRKDDVYHRSALDSLKMGDLTVKPKYVYVFWVKKKQVDLAHVIIKTLK